MHSLAGQFGLVPIDGWAGVAIAAGQLIARPKVKATWRESRDASHVFVVLADGQTVAQAMPGGLRLDSIEPYLDGRPVQFSSMQLTARQIARIDAVARSMEGTEYAYLQYPAIGLERLGFHPRMLRAYIATTHHMICSQSADETYRRSGIYLFDGYLPQQVIPLDFADWLLTHRGWAPPETRSAA